MSRSESLMLAAAAASAAAIAASFVVSQTDQVSRRILTPDRLDSKRHADYKDRWEAAMERAYLQLTCSLAGGQQKLKADKEAVAKKTESVSSDDDMDGLVRRILKEKESKFVTLKIDKDPHDPTGEFYLYIMADVPAKGTELFQVPMMAFAEKLERAFDEQLTTTTLCFVADASSGKASSLLEQLVRESKTGVAILSEPLWMVELANLAQSNLFPNAKLQTLFFALCRLDSWSLRDESKDSRTVLITFPGQTTVPSLLPLAQQAFPADRHVFAYDGCAASTQRGMAAEEAYKPGDNCSLLEGIIHTMCNDPIRHTTPFPNKSPLTRALIRLGEKLSHLNLPVAQGVEAWMSSVDAFFKLKDNDSKNGYLPYVFRMTFLTKPDDKEFTKESDAYWILSSLLQYVTGTRSRPVPEGRMDSAIEFLKDYNENPEPPTCFTEAQNKIIEDCVFQHKSILLGNKLLKDSVLPVQHWTLKQSTRAGCSCCGPDPYDEEEEENELVDTGMGIDLNTPGAFATMSTNGNRASAPSVGPAFTTATKSSDYVDGKLGFAFDPTKFS